MRRILSISLLCFYLITSFSLTVTAHYCDGSLASIAVFENATCCCERQNDHQDHDCCKDEVKTIRISDEQIKADPGHGRSIQNAPEHFSPPSYRTGYLRTEVMPIIIPFITKVHDSNQPIPLYKRNHAFLFYS